MTELTDLFLNLNLENKNTEIEKFLSEQFCAETEETLSDFSLMQYYVASESYKNESKKLQDILEKYVPDKPAVENIIKDYSDNLVKAATKSSIRGKKFNDIVGQKIISLKKELFMDDEYIIQFETKPPGIKISEKPDWYIQNIKTNKTLIGMNQISLDNGGHQTNRAAKYLYDDNKDYKLICVICNKLTFGSKSKMNEMILHGVRTDRLCYINGIKEILKRFFIA